MPNPGAETETENLIENKTETLSGKFSKAIGSIKNGTKYVGSVLVHLGQEYNQGLFGLVVALVTFGIERLLDDQVFSCPRRQHDVYASIFLFVPGFVLLMVNLITVPAAGKFHIWTICERCFVKNYRQRGDCLTGLSSAIGVGFVAPTVWFFLALLNGQHLVCWELGFQLGTNITKKYLRRRDINMTVTDYTDKVHDVKAKSQFIGAIVFGMVVFILVAVIVFKRSFIKPFDVNEKLPGLHEFEKREALAASKELKRLLKGEDNPELSSVADIVYCQKLLAVIERLQKLEAKRKMKSVESSSESQVATEDEKQYKLFKDVLEAWNKFKELENRVKGLEERPRENTDEETENAKKAFEKVHSDLISRQDKRISKAEQELESEEENMLNADDRKEAIMKVKEKLEVLMKLKEQKEEFEINKAIKRWNADDEGQVEVRKLGNKLLAQAEEGRADTPEMRGKFVAAYIIELYRQRRKEYLHSQHVLDKFADIYPRAASSNPCQRYVDVGDETYNTIFTDYKKVVKADQPLPVRYSLRALVSKHDQDGGHSSGSSESPHIDHRDEAV